MMHHADEDDAFFFRERRQGILSRIPFIRDLSRRNQYIAVGLFVSLLLFLVVILPIIIVSSEKEEPTNVIFMISDGFGATSEAFARVTLESENNPDFNLTSATLPTAALPLDKYLRGSSRTYSSNSYITDSSAGATAFSCGIKTFNLAIAVDDNNKPCGTILEAAKAKGMKTGLVATSRITHATPASFSSHSIHRDWEDFIAKQQIDIAPDLMFGGGAKFYVNRYDGIDLFDYAKTQKGYNIARNLQDFNSAKSLPLLAILANDNLDFDIDRDPQVQPSLAEMTTKALSLLQGSKKGFFLMVEGSRIDHAGHNNDPMAHYRDILAYQNAVQVVADFVKKNPKTLVISVSDHETGGLTLGRDSPYEWHPEFIWRAKASSEKVASLIMANQSNIAGIFKQYLQLDITADEQQTITSSISTTSNQKLIIAIGAVVSKRALLGWTTVGHTGADVGLYSFGHKSDDIIGNYENTDVGKYVVDLLDLDLAKETEKLSNFSPIRPGSKRSTTVSNNNDEYHRSLF